MADRKPHVRVRDTKLGAELEIKKSVLENEQAAAKAQKRPARYEPVRSSQAKPEAKPKKEGDE